MFNIEKTKKHIKMTREITAKQINEGIAKDMYGIEERLISWAYANIPTKELKKIIKKEEEEMERLSDDQGNIGIITDARIRENNNE